MFLRSEFNGTVIGVDVIGAARYPLSPQVAITRRDRVSGGFRVPGGPPAAEDDG